jgi:hypothetical protein
MVFLSVRIKSPELRPRNNFRLFYQTGTLEKTPKIEVGEWADTRFVDEVLKEIGTYANLDPPAGRCDRVDGYSKRIYENLSQACHPRMFQSGVQSELRLDSR